MPAGKLSLLLTPYRPWSHISIMFITALPYLRIKQIPPLHLRFIGLQNGWNCLWVWHPATTYRVMAKCRRPTRWIWCWQSIKLGLILTSRLTMIKTTMMLSTRNLTLFKCILSYQMLLFPLNDNPILSLAKWDDIKRHPVMNQVPLLHWLIQSPSTYKHHVQERATTCLPWVLWSPSSLFPHFPMQTTLTRSPCRKW